MTSGPSFEPLDQVRRLTNFSTGRLGTLLAAQLKREGHRVHLLRGSGCSYPETSGADEVELFGTSEDLRLCLERRSSPEVGALFHAAAVSDFAFGPVWQQLPTGELQPVQEGKISTSHDRLFAELRPTAKIIRMLRNWFPKYVIVGWKYEVDGNRPDAIGKARAQIELCRTDWAVANGPAYGTGYALVSREGAVIHCADTARLLEALLENCVRANENGQTRAG